MTEFWEPVKDFFIEQRAKNVQIPGIGYGRNVMIHHGSVTDMPFY